LKKKFKPKEANLKKPKKLCKAIHPLLEVRGPQNGVTYFLKNRLILITLGNRQIAENLIEIHLYLPEMSLLLKCGVGTAPRSDNIFQHFFT